MPANATLHSIELGDDERISGLLIEPAAARCGFVLAHGAGAGMSHAFMESLATALADRGVATLRYQFLYMEKKSRRPDPPQRAHAAVRAAVREAARLLPSLPLFAGGKSFGGRMTSQAQALDPLVGVRGLVFVGFPLHPAGRAATERAEHLASVTVPMLFLQGSRDDLADLDLIRGVVDGLGGRATLDVIEGADHSFHVPARTGANDEAVMQRLADTAAQWMSAH